MEATGVSPKYPFQIIDPAHSGASSGPSGNTKAPKLNGHTVSVHKTAMRAIEAIGEECAICCEELKDDGFRFPKPFSELSCGHLYHTDCINKSRDNVRANCPLCNRSCKNYSDPKVHSYRDGMIPGLPAQCSEETCEIESVGDASLYECPYPLSLMSLSQLGCFIKENKQVLTEWMIKYFKTQGYPHCEVINSEEPDQASSIRIVVKKDEHQLEEPPLFYHDIDIKGVTARRCFRDFSEDVKTDKLFLDFKQKHPEYFDGSSELTIRNWHFYQDSVNFSNGMSISLRAIINSEKTEIDLDRLLGEVHQHYNDQDRLMSPAPGNGHRITYL